MGPESARSDASGELPAPAPVVGGARFRSDVRTIPNLLSLARIVAVLVAASLYLYGYRGLGLALGLAAGITDLLDGYLARKLDQSTELGAILDRLSDLVLETTALVVAIYLRILPPVYFLVYLLREFVVLSARLYVSERGGTIPTSMLGRVKTNFFSISFALLFAVDAGLLGDARVAESVHHLGHGVMVAALAVSLLSGAQYLRSFAAQYDGQR